MENILPFITENAVYAPYIIFSLLILAGFYLPISEDLMIVTGALLAANSPYVDPLFMFLWIFAGCYLSDWIAYGLGRALGLKILKIPILSKAIDKERLESIHSFYEHYGFWTLLIGRFIPFGVRNCLFLTAGMGKMSFPKFILSDGIACIVSNSTLFLITLNVGRNAEEILAFLKTFYLVFVPFLLVILGAFLYRKRLKASKEQS